MSVTAFNNSRRQAMALADAKARDDLAQNTPLNQKLDAKQMSEFARKSQEELPKMASPPYPDEARLINIPADAELDREFQAAEQAELNKTRVPSYEAREELQNAHWRDDKTKAIPDHDEAGQKRDQFSMQPIQAEIYDPQYSDMEAPQRDGRLRARQQYASRPDVDITESKKSRQKGPKVSDLPKDDQPKEVGEIIKRGNAKAAERLAATTEYTMVDAGIDPKEALQTGGISKMIKTEPVAPNDPPGPNHSADDDMPELGKSAEAGIEADPTKTDAAKTEAAKRPRKS